MSFRYPILSVLCLLGFGLMPLSSNAVPDPAESWRPATTSDGSVFTPRHEAGAVEVGGKLYLMGGRGSRPAEVFDPIARSWRNLGPAPMELHHFQPVAIGNTIYVIGAMTCCYPEESSVETIYLFDTQTESWSTGSNIPAARARGSAGAVVHNGKIYLVGGNTNGHSGGAVGWFDVYDPVNDQWQILPNAPHARDHFNAVIVGDKLVAAAGRRSDLPDPFDHTVAGTDVFDFVTNQWTGGANIPTVRAGAIAVAYDGAVIVAGGEVDTSSDALDTVEAYNVATDSWYALQSLEQKRHSGGGTIVGNRLHMVSGSVLRGGGGANETLSHEYLALDSVADDDNDGDGLSNHEENDQWHTDPELADTDADGLDDGDEVAAGADPLLPDTDGDGLLDGAEVNQHHTSPTLKDTDGDSLDDDVELSDTLTDPTQADTDDDGLRDDRELELGTNPHLADTDGDTLSDAVEVNDSMTNPLLRDSDADGLTDDIEISEYQTDPLLADTDADGLGDGVEVLQYSTNPLVADTDADGVSDGLEIESSTDPLDSDSDDDTLTDGEEAALGTNPNLVDTDADGIPDAEDDDPLAAPMKKGGAIGLLMVALGIVRLLRVRLV
ncbi:MAG: hypothetical protein V3U76_05250 [Granulosicoccus sp.]